MEKIEYRVELANKIRGGRCIGNLYGVAKYKNGCRCGYVIDPADISLASAREAAASLAAGCRTQKVVVR